MKRLGQILCFYLMLLWLGAMLLLGNVASLPLWLLPRRWREPFMRDMMGRTFHLFLSGCELCGLIELDLRELDALQGQRGLVIVANHPSMIDVFLVVSRVRQVLCLMKSSLAGNLFLAVGARLAGYIPNRHIDVMIRQAAQAVAQGQMLLVFPEGTRTEVHPLNELKSGAMLVARRAHAPLQVVVLEASSAYLGKGWPIWRPPAFPMRYRARLGPRLQVTGSLPETATALQQTFMQELRDVPAPSQR
ncbi:lysophospholipid acyltransferase family protein [Aquabacterium parvum]|uniref:lysophospholipid acyltransferase family protein n=1 Tax=Aquabacterium parvum TaxID=70584 RepID=UPI000718DF11|nr:lysophospholipid acyltransferase family protein [Aquabacterium parvum]